MDATVNKEFHVSDPRHITSEPSMFRGWLVPIKQSAKENIRVSIVSKLLYIQGQYY
jgi:hypothetical protein